MFSPLRFPFHLLGGLLLWLAACATPARAQSVSDAELLCAFQERYIASFGVPFPDFPRSLSNQPVLWPKPGDYDAATMESVIGSTAFEHIVRLARLTTTTGNAGQFMFYLEQESEPPAANWGELKRRLVRLSPTLGESYYRNLPYPEKRKLFVATLQRMKIRVGALYPKNLFQKDGYGYFWTAPEAAAFYESTPDATPYPPNVPLANMLMQWSANFYNPYLASYGFNYGPNMASFLTMRSSLTPGAHLENTPWAAYLHIWSGFNPNAADPTAASRIASALESRGILLGPAFKTTNRTFDLGNWFSFIPETVRGYAKASFELRNIDSDSPCYSVAYPAFVYLPKAADCSACSQSCAPGAAVDGLSENGISATINLGSSRQGQATARLFIEAAGVTDDLYSPRSIQTDLTPDFTATRDAGGGFRQAYNNSVIADAQPLPPLSPGSSSPGYEIKLYARPPGLDPDAVTGLLPLAGLTPAHTHRFRNPVTGIPPGMVPGRVVLHESVTDGSNYQFMTLPANGSDPASNSISRDGGISKETATHVATVNAANEVITSQTRTVANAAGETVSANRRVIRNGPQGPLLESETTDPNGTNLTTTYTYENDDPERLSLVVSPDGSWQQFEYDELNRRTKTRTPYLDSPPTCTDAECRVLTVSYAAIGDTLTTTSTETLLGQEIARSYRVESPSQIKDVTCTVPGAALTDATNLVTTTDLFPSGWFQRKPSRVTAPDGTVTTYAYETSPANVFPSDATSITTTIATGTAASPTGPVTDGTRTLSQTNVQGKVIFEETTDIASGLTLTSRAATVVDLHGRPTTWTFEDGTTEILNYDCCGLASRTDRTGLTTSNTRHQSVTRVGVPASAGPVAALESTESTPLTYLTANGTSANGFLTRISREEGLTSRTFRQGADGTLIETSRITRDPAGRPLTSTDAMGRPTTSVETYDYLSQSRAGFRQ